MPEEGGQDGIFTYKEGGISILLCQINNAVIMVIKRPITEIENASIILLTRQYIK